MSVTVQKLFAPFPHDLPSLRKLIRNGQSLRDESVYAPARVVQIGGGLVVKYGDTVRLSEALATELVRTETHIPVPRVLAYFREAEPAYPHGVGYIVMEQVSGVMLSEVLDTLHDDAIERITHQLSDYLLEMKKLDRPDEWGMVGKDGVYHRDPRFNYQHPGRGELGPFVSNPLRAKCCRDVIEYFARGTDRSHNEEWAAEAQAIVNSFDNTHPSSFCHPDLVPENIMVNVDEGRITGIIDWQGAGWYPYFWMSWVARNREQVYSRIQAERWNRIWIAMMKEYPESRGLGKLVWEAEGCGFEDYSGSL